MFWGVSQHSTPGWKQALLAVYTAVEWQITELLAFSLKRIQPHLIASFSAPTVPSSGIDTWPAALSEDVNLTEIVAVAGAAASAVLAASDSAIVNGVNQKRNLNVSSSKFHGAGDAALRRQAADVRWLLGAQSPIRPTPRLFKPGDVENKAAPRKRWYVPGFFGGTFS